MLAASVMLGIVSIVSGPATASPESLVYTLLGILMLIGWALLKWKLSGYARLDKWFKQNLPSYNKVSPAQKADFLDDVYFAHQELIQGDRLAELKYNRTLVRAKAVYISTLVITLLLYFISEFDHRFYSNWIWVIAAIESVYMLILNVEHTSDDRVYLGKLCNEVMIHDFNRLNENVRAMEDIWNKLDRGYKSKLVRVYEDEFRAKKAMINYMSRCIKAWTSVR
jgi:hypothetical protein